MTMNKPLITAFCFLMLANIGMLYDLQTDAIQDSKPLVEGAKVTKNKPTSEQNRLAQLESRFENLSAEIAMISQSLNRLTEATAQNSTRLQGSLAHKQNHQAVNKDQAASDTQPQVFAESIENVLELGILDEHAWQSMEQDIAAMSKEESAAFWTIMIAKIAQDEFVTNGYEH